LLDKVQEFEKYLDNEMKKLGIMRYNRFESIEAVGVVYEMAIHMGCWEWKVAIDVLVSQLLTNRAGVKTGVPAETVISALQFSQLYYHLRDYLFSHIMCRAPSSGISTRITRFELNS